LIFAELTKTTLVDHWQLLLLSITMFKMHKQPKENSMDKKYWTVPYQSSSLKPSHWFRNEVPRSSKQIEFLKTQDRVNLEETKIKENSKRSSKETEITRIDEANKQYEIIST
jgi:hypothetical protein